MNRPPDLFATGHTPCGPPWLLGWEEEEEKGYKDLLQQRKNNPRPRPATTIISFLAFHLPVFFFWLPHRKTVCKVPSKNSMQSILYSRSCSSSICDILQIPFAYYSCLFIIPCSLATGPISFRFLFGSKKVSAIAWSTHDDNAPIDCDACCSM